MIRGRLLLVGLAVAWTLGWAESAAGANPLPTPSDMRATGGSFDLSAACRVRAGVFVDNARVPDGDGRSRVTAYYQMENQPDDGQGGRWDDAWASWGQAEGRSEGGFAEMDLYRQDVNPLAFERGYIGTARRWEGVRTQPSDVPPTNLPYSVWSFGYRTYGPDGVREDWRVLDGRSTNGGPAASLANVDGVVRKTDRPAQPLPTTVRAGAGTGQADSGILRLTGSDRVTRAWTREQSVTFSMTALDSVCPSALVADPAHRDASTLPTCEPDPVAFVPCWDHAVAANSSPMGTLDHHADGTFGRSPYCSHLAGQTVPYRQPDRSDCPAKSSRAEYEAGGVLPSWWCTTKTTFGFCAQSQVDWLGYRQRRTWMQVRDLSTGGEAHRLMDRWYGDPQGNTSRGECPRLPDGSADRSDPRTCFYEGWWEGELTYGLSSDGRHEIEVETVDETFRSWLAGAPIGLQNRNGSRIPISRDRRGPIIEGRLTTDDDPSGLRFSASGIVDPGGTEAAIGVNPSDVWLYACLRSSLGCDGADIPETGGGRERVQTRMSTSDGADFTVVLHDVEAGEWRWKVVPYDLLGNAGVPRQGADRSAARALPAADAASVAPGGTVDVDIAVNDRWGPISATTTFDLIGPPPTGAGVLVDRPGATPVLRYTATTTEAAGASIPMTYELCASIPQDTDCTAAVVTVGIVQADGQRRPT